jgi:Holliday junction DNA helicase RuvA
MGESLLVDIGALVLQVHTSGTTIADAGEPGAEVRLHTYLHVREDQIALYGFGTTEELALFNLLLTVTGIGHASPPMSLGATGRSRC